VHKLTDRMRLVVSAALLCGLASCVFVGSAGCAAWGGPAAMPSEFVDLTKAVSSSTLSQSIWDTMQTRVGAEAIEPGLEIGGGVKTYAYSRIIGVAGRVGVDAQGHGSGQLTDAQIANVQAALVDKDAAVRRFWERLLGLDDKALDSRELPAATQPAQQGDP